MSGIVENEEKRKEEVEFNSFLEELVKTGDLRGTAAEGIAKYILAEGKEKLSEKQKFVFEPDILKKFSATCEECYQSIPWSEAYEFYHSPGRCAACQVRYEEYMSKD
jgi:hypothetical protein